MKDTEIIFIQLLIERLRKTQNAVDLYLCANCLNIANYVEHSRFNRLVASLFTIIKEIRKNIFKNENLEFKIVDSFPLVVNKFGRPTLGKN